MYLTQEQIIHIEQNKRASYHWVYHGLVFPKALQLRICVLMLDETGFVHERNARTRERTSWISIARRATSIGKTKSVLVSTIWYGVLCLEWHIWE
jgi:hypothetical protein